MRKKISALLMAIALGSLLGMPPVLAQGEANLREALARVLREHPELVLDVLRENSEAVLDIAQQGSDLRRKRSLEAQWREDAKTPKEIRLEGRPVKGDINAKVRIVAFTDFTCHYCQLATKTVDRLLADYGKNVCLVFKSMPLEDKGTGALAAQYFMALSQQNAQAAWQLYRELFEGQSQLVSDGEKYIRQSAEKLGADMRRLNRDAQSRKIRAMQAEDMEDAQKLGVEGTPYFLVNNMVVRGALPLELFRVAVEMGFKNPVKPVSAGKVEEKVNSQAGPMK